MKRFVYALALCAICCGPSYGEEEGSTPRRRPRIRVYDESTKLIPVTRESDSHQASREDMNRRIRQDRPLSSGLQAPGGVFSPVPSLIEPQWVPAQQESSDDRDSSWINPLDFLSEEDLYETDDLEDESASENTQPELEIMAWEDLQTDMIRETLTNRPDDELTMEEWEELTRGSNENVERDAQASGLDLEPVAPVDSPESFNDSSTSRAEQRERTDMSLFTPILRMERRGAEPPADIGSPERNQPVEFTGSRKLFNQIKENQAPAMSGALPAGQADRIVAGPRFEPVESAVQPDRIRAAALPGAGFGGADLSTLPPPGAGAAGTTRLTPNTMPEPGSGAPQRDPERFRPSENRIRSQLGPAGGLGF